MFPSTTKLLVTLQSTMDSSKKPRMQYQTPLAQTQRPVTGMSIHGTPLGPLGSAQPGDILDYLKGRGGKIKELEDAVHEQRSAKEALACQLQLAQQQIKSLEQRLSSSGLPSSTSTPAYITELENLVSERSSRVLQLEQELAAAREVLVSTQVSAQQTQMSLQFECQQATQKAQQHEATLASLQREVQMLRGQCATETARAARATESEASQRQAAAEVQRTHAAALKDAQARIAERDEQIAALLRQLPSTAAVTQTLAEHEAMQRLKADLASAEQREAAALAACKAATERATTAEATTHRLEKEAEQLAQQVGHMQEKLGLGAFNKNSNTRILHLRMNPEAEYHQQAAQEQASVLEAQVQALAQSLAEAQAALTAMEARAVAAESAAAACDATTRPSTSVASTATVSATPTTSELLARLAARDQELAVLKQKQADSDKVTGRLKAVFKERTNVYREAVYCLFGYRVDMVSEAAPASSAASAITTFSLRPQHADSPDDVLVFKYTPEGGMQLVPTVFTTRRLAREVETFVHRFKCIPALTANLTMDSFQKQTQC